MNKRFLRIPSVSLPEIEQAQIESMARSGYAVKDFTARNIYFTPSTPQNLRARVIPSDISGKSYLDFVASMKAQGWDYAANDGVEHSLFITTDTDAAEPNVDISLLEKIYKRRIKSQLFLAVIGTILMLTAFIINFTRLGGFRGNFRLTQMLFYSGWLLLDARWAFSAWTEFHNLQIARGHAQKRHSKFEYIVHVLLEGCMIMAFVMSFVAYCISVKGNL